MESTEEKVEEYTEGDGTRVIKKTIIKRIKPAGSGFSKSAVLSGPTKTLDVADPKSMNEFEVAFLKKHNEYRALHGVPPLKLSREVRTDLITNSDLHKEPFCFRYYNTRDIYNVYYI